MHSFSDINLLFLLLPLDTLKPVRNFPLDGMRPLASIASFDVLALLLGLPTEEVAMLL